MPNIERTSAGFQAVIPGCERRTLPKSTTSSDDTGQGLLDFYRPPTLREKLAALADAPCSREVVKGDDREASGGWLGVGQCPLLSNNGQIVAVPRTSALCH